MAGSSRIPDTFRLDGGSVIDTDASHGIGRALARGFAKAGAGVAIPHAKPCDRTEKLLDETSVLSRNRTCISQIDIGTPEDLSRMAAEAEAHLERINGPVNEDPTGLSAAPEDVKLAQLQLMIRVSLTGPYLAFPGGGSADEPPADGGDRKIRLTIDADGQLRTEAGALPRGKGGYVPAAQVLRRGVGASQLSGRRPCAWLHPHRVARPDHRPRPAGSQRALVQARGAESVLGRGGTRLRRRLPAPDAPTCMTREEMVVDGSFTLR